MAGSSGPYPASVSERGVLLSKGVSIKGSGVGAILFLGGHPGFGFGHGLGRGGGAGLLSIIFFEGS